MHNLCHRVIFLSVFFCLIFMFGTEGQTVVISGTVNNGGFESGGASWNVSNGSQTNKWFVGTTSFCSGSQAAFIGTSSTTNTYSTTSPSVVHLYRDVVFPVNESQITLSFDFKCQGESVFDYMRIFIVPPTTTPNSGTTLATGQIGNTYYNLTGVCTNYSITLNPAFAGTTQRLVFSWINDGSLGSNPPATLDNVTILTQLPSIPNCATLTSPANAVAGLCNSGVVLNWTAPITGSAPTGYSVYLGTNNPPNNVINGTNVGNVLTYSAPSLLPNTTYYWQVVPFNSAGQATGCTIRSFTTSSNCFIQTTNGNFTGCSGSFFDPGGSAANYPNSNSSVTTICPSSAGQYLTATFNSFQLESCCDFLKIYNGNSITAPLLGTYTGTTLPSCISATGGSGCLTFQFSSDGSVTYTGWDATITCTSTPGVCLPSCANVLSPTNGATGICTNGQQLSWTPSTSGSTPSAYQLYLGTNNPPTNLMNGTNIGNVLSYNPGVLTPNTTYYWKVVPLNTSGSAQSCAVWSFNTGGSCIQQSNGAQYNVCSGVFYDSGGQSGNYSDNEYSTTTICPTSAGQFIQLNFTSFNLEAGFDDLTVYNGSTASSLIGSYTGTGSPCSITSTAPDGCLTTQFSSDVVTTYSGWSAIVNCVSSAAPSLPGSTCSNAPITPLPWNLTNQTTACYGDDYTSATSGSCATLYSSGEDRVYAFNASSASCLSISITNASTSFIGYQVYFGCPGAGGLCVGSNGGNANLAGSVSLPAAGTYYVIIDTWAPPSNATFNLSVSASGSQPSNDSICNAVSLPLGVNLTGTNACSGNLGDPATPSCWTSGTVNSVWYRVVAPASGQLRIRTTLGTNTNTQIALYGGSCSSPALISCNTNSPPCGSSYYNNSELAITGLVAGATYYIAVDGENDITGTFDIIAIDNLTQFPPAAGQECSSPNPVCDTTIQIGNPGYQAFGNSCDFNGTGTCLAAGERGSAWYLIPIAASGVLQFNIIPNDWAGAPSTSATDYDFAIWRTSGTGAVNCLNISAGAVPVTCNYSALGVTGLAGSLGNAPVAFPGFDGSYEPQLNVTAGETYVLVISNFSNSTSGFTLDFNPSSPINYTSPGTANVVWTGGTNTQWSLQSNWGGCAAPKCGINASLSPSSVNQPVLLGGMVDTVNNLTINPGSTLTMLAGSTLRICGNFTNYGSLVADPSATIIFCGPAKQTIAGALIGTDKFPNLIINKLPGTDSVILANDIDIGGSFSTVTTSSFFNSNGKYIKLAGNFANNNGNATFCKTGTTGVLEFNGVVSQTYHQGSSRLDLNSVIMNHSGPGVVLATNLCIKTVTGQLTLNSGKIITDTFEVRVNNTASTSVSTGNNNSYIKGNLRRYLLSVPAAYDFPVGAATFERANINFSSNAVNNLRACFVPYTTIPPALGIKDCNRQFNFQPLNNGKWIIDAYSDSVTRVYGLASYNMTLYNTNFTNAGGSNAWTVMKDSIGAGAWYLNGVCDTTSTVNVVKRLNMNGFSHFATAQGGIVLPVELLRFEGHNAGSYNVIQWTTATEWNNNHFTLMRSADGNSFQPIAQLPGAGTSSTTHNYEYIDKKPLSGVNYYQLKQTDFDGTQSASEVIVVKNTTGDFSIVTMRPNPNDGRLFIDFHSYYSGQGSIRINDLQGRTLVTQNVTINSDLTTFEMDLSSLSKGIYALTIVLDNHEKMTAPQLFIRQ
jgi:hypothetical protein